jgi:hypothetical protein
MEKARRKFWIVGLILSAGILAVALRGYWSRPRNEPDLSSLNHYLEGTAQKVLSLSKVADATVEVKVSRAALQSEVDRIKDLAAKFGGSAVADSNSQTGADLLAEIPEQLADQFTEAVRVTSKAAPEGTPSLGAKTVLVEVKLVLKE